MNIQNPQIQLKISLSEQLNHRLESKAARLGVPVTQLVKHLILKEVEIEDYPVYQASERVEKNSQDALKQIDKAVDASAFFKTLNEG
jgi:predicted DNA-binding protein